MIMISLDYEFGNNGDLSALVIHCGYNELETCYTPSYLRSRSREKSCLKGYKKTSARLELVG